MNADKAFFLVRVHRRSSAATRILILIVLGDFRAPLESGKSESVVGKKAIRTALDSEKSSPQKYH
jgi:hypothetical protein